MADFTGMTVKITLKHPPGIVLHGKVKELVAGQALTLQDAYFPATGARWDNWVVQSTAIQDLGVIDTTSHPPPPSSVRPSAGPPLVSSNTQTSLPPVSSSSAALQPQQIPTTQQVPAQAQPATFVDPAILSYGKSPAPPVNDRSSIPKVERSNRTQSSQRVVKNGSPIAGVSKQHEIVPETRDDAIENAADGTHAETGSKKKRRGGQKKRNAQLAVQTTSVEHDPPPVMNVEVSRNGNDMGASVRRGKGWRQGPFLQPSPQTLSAAESLGTKKHQPTRRQRDEEAERKQNGWATEDATDIQDMGDFDFEANHKLFDKKQIFDELRQGDTTADEDRLVSHNKAHRPGTYGGKNLHPTENVLSPLLLPKTTGNELESSSDADTELNLDNGRSSSKVSLSRSAVATKNQRQSSLMLEGKPHTANNPTSLDRGVVRSATSLSVASRGRRQISSIATSSPQPERIRSPQSAVSTVRDKAPLSAAAQEPHFTIIQTLTNCPILHPVALDTLEAETISRYGVPQDAITENAARCVAEVAMGMFNTVEGSRRVSRATTMRASMTSSMTLDRASVPVVVIIAGNHPTGARAIAAARHIICHGAEVIIAEAQYESTDTQDTQLRTQIAILKRMMKAGATIRRGPWKRAFGYIKNLPGPPAVIIDALLAGSSLQSMSSSNTSLTTEFQRESREMIDWANRSRAPVLSIGCPSGVSGVDGSALMVEGEPLAVQPGKVLSLGVPMLGLLEALKNGERWDVNLADIGINIALRSEEAVAFGAQWVTEVEFVEADGTV